MHETWKRRTRRVLVPWMLLLALSVAGSAEAKVWTVTNDNDNGAVGTLRHAVTNATSGDEIRIPILALVLENQIFVNKNLVIVGTCPDGAPHVKQLAEDRVMEIAPGVTCTLRNLRLTGGKPKGGHGGGIRNQGTLEMVDCTIQGNYTRNYNGGGIHNGGTLTLSGCTVTGNRVYGSLACGGGIFTYGAPLTLKNGCTVKDNGYENILGSYVSDGTNTIGDTPGRSSVALEGLASGSSPTPESTVGEPDVQILSQDLRNEKSSIFQDVAQVLSADLGGLPAPSTGEAGMNATLYNAFTYEDLPLDDASGAGAIVVEFTASWPERVRYYAALARSDGSGYELPLRGVRFEIQPGQELPGEVTPPDFYIPGEGLMTWQHTVTDGGSFDLNPAPGAVTFRTVSLRAAAPTPAPDGTAAGGGGCRTGTGLGALLFLPGLFLPLRRRRNG